MPRELQSGLVRFLEFLTHFEFSDLFFNRNTAAKWHKRTTHQVETASSSLFKISHKAAWDLHWPETLLGYNTDRNLNIPPLNIWHHHWNYFDVIKNCIYFCFKENMKLHSLSHPRCSDSVVWCPAAWRTRLTLGNVSTVKIFNQWNDLNFCQLEDTRKLHQLPCWGKWGYCC